MVLAFWDAQHVCQVGRPRPRPVYACPLSVCFLCVCLFACARTMRRPGEMLSSVYLLMLCPWWDRLLIFFLCHERRLYGLFCVSLGGISAGCLLCFLVVGVA